MKKIGIMGGTFNPIHIGHLLLAEWAMDAEALDEIWVIPTGCSYMKAEQNVLSGQERYEMTCKAIEDNLRMKCLDIEILRTGYTYTYETILELRDKYPEYSFYFIFGADCLFTIETWKNPRMIFDNCSIIAAVRGDSPIEQMQEKIEELCDKYHADIRLLPFLQLEVSSTGIRERVKAGQSIKYLVPDKVISYIEEKGFYGYEGK